LPWAKEHRVPTNPSLWILSREAVGKQLLAIQRHYEVEYDRFVLSGMFQRGEIEKAIDFAGGCLAHARMETARRVIHLIQGYCLLKSHQPEAAIAAFDKVGEAYPECMDAHFGRAAAYGVLGDAKKTADNIAAARAVRATHANMPLHLPPIDKGLDGDRELAQKLDLDERLYPLRDEILHEIGRIQLWSGYSVSADSFSSPNLEGRQTLAPNHP
jgi:tetratricopeptide (TPR) repeat protein